MAVAPALKADPKSRLRSLRQRSASADTSVRGNADERAAHQLATLEDWRPLRKLTTK